MSLPMEKDFDGDYKSTLIHSHIDLSLILKQDERLRKYVTFDGIKEDSYLRYSELELSRRLKLMKKKKQNGDD